MTPLTSTELVSIQGGWDWDNFLSGAAIGCGIAAITLATGGGSLVGGAAVLAWTGVGISVLNLYL
jgi:hypothetical protein